MYRHRYRRIVWFFARLLAGIIAWDLCLPRLGFRAWAARTRPQRLRRAGRGFRLMAVQMGGVLIKIGQFLSTRVDVLPDEITSELAGLQDEVPAENFERIRAAAEAELGDKLEVKFTDFDPQPLAAASLGQVHRARLPLDPRSIAPDSAGSMEVVVKVLRPDIERIISVDLAALRTVGAWLMRYRPLAKRVNIPALLDEFTRILYQEINYLQEGKNAETFASNFRRQPRVRVPKVIWTHTTRRVLTLENVMAIKITDYSAIEAAGISRRAVAVLLLDTYLKQIFEDGFFHADPHPGNLFVQPCEITEQEIEPEIAQQNWQLTFVDFGMVGRISPQTRQGLREMVIGVGTRDAGRVIRSYQMLGLLLPGADLALLERAESRLFERFWGMTMDELRNISPAEVQKIAGEFRQLLFELPFQVPHDLIFTVRCVGILSGMCTGLEPSFNVWEQLAPYAQKLIAEETMLSRESFWSELQRVAKAFLVAPSRLSEVLTQVQRGEIEVRTPEMRQEARRLEAAIRQATGGVVFAAFLLGGIQLYLGGYEMLGAALMAGAGLSLVWTIFRRR